MEQVSAGLKVRVWEEQRDIPTYGTIMRGDVHNYLHITAHHCGLCGVRYVGRSDHLA
ncbi:hypothetical protein HNR77_005225 [Paenibacillus sp. JGP012]|uniref:hypothetical protein n=1 Tax=Paenibacillus sp. JGP012 TaxID=2735914 RepID=UPI00160A5C82|nr:hypothetical protein [Paenibacillus sp. JGP012]MBB6024121.1 hypothetical protein [Paenibacillus sp. JGP012]